MAFEPSSYTSTASMLSAQSQWNEEDTQSAESSDYQDEDEDGDRGATPNVESESDSETDIESDTSYHSSDSEQSFASASEDVRQTRQPQPQVPTQQLRKPTTLRAPCLLKGYADVISPSGNLNRIQLHINMWPKQRRRVANGALSNAGFGDVNDETIALTGLGYDSFPRRLVVSGELKGPSVTVLLQDIYTHARLRIVGQFDAVHNRIIGNTTTGYLGTHDTDAGRATLEIAGPAEQLGKMTQPFQLGWGKQYFDNCVGAGQLSHQIFNLDIQHIISACHDQRMLNVEAALKNFPVQPPHRTRRRKGKRSKQKPLSFRTLLSLPPQSLQHYLKLSDPHDAYQLMGLLEWLLSLREYAAWPSKPNPGNIPLQDPLFCHLVGYQALLKCSLQQAVIYLSLPGVGASQRLNAVIPRMWSARTADLSQAINNLDLFTRRRRDNFRRQNDNSRPLLFVQHLLAVPGSQLREMGLDGAASELFDFSEEYVQYLRDRPKFATEGSNLLKFAAARARLSDLYFTMKYVSSETLIQQCSTLTPPELQAFCDTYMNHVLEEKELEASSTQQQRVIARRSVNSIEEDDDELEPLIKRPNSVAPWHFLRWLGPLIVLLSLYVAAAAVTIRIVETSMPDTPDGSGRSSYRAGHMMCLLVVPALGILVGIMWILACSVAVLLKPMLSKLWTFSLIVRFCITIIMGVFASYVYLTSLRPCSQPSGIECIMFRAHTVLFLCRMLAMVLFGLAISFAPNQIKPPWSVGYFHTVVFVFAVCTQVDISIYLSSFLVLEPNSVWTVSPVWLPPLICLWVLDLVCVFWPVLRRASQWDANPDHEFLASRVDVDDLSEVRNCCSHFLTSFGHCMSGLFAPCVKPCRLGQTVRDEDRDLHEVLTDWRHPDPSISIDDLQQLQVSPFLHTRHRIMFRGTTRTGPCIVSVVPVGKFGNPLSLTNSPRPSKKKIPKYPDMLHQMQQYAAREAIMTTSSMEGYDVPNEVFLCDELTPHPNVLHYLGWGAVGDTPFLLFETVECTLNDLLQSSKPLEPGDKLRMMHDAAMGLAHLHSQRIMHRNVTPNAFFLDRHRTLKVGNLSQSRKAPTQRARLNTTMHVLPPGHPDRPLTPRPGTFPFMAPETMTASTDYSLKADVFSFGLCMYSTWTGKNPFIDEFRTVNEVEMEVSRRGARPRLPRDCPRAYIDLASRCWNADPSNRPDMTFVARDLLTLSR